jgi:hypothetical protein
MPKEPLKKTTVQFPNDVLRGIRQYMIDHDMTTHDQSIVIVTAVKEFLSKEFDQRDTTA